MSPLRPSQYTNPNSAPSSRRSSVPTIRRDWSRVLAAAEQERRLQQRHAAPLSVALLHREERHELCLVRNISAGGLQGQVYRTVERGSTLEVEIRPGERIPAKVVWSRDWHIGVEFLRLVDLDEALKGQFTRNSDPEFRSPRLEVSCPGRLQIGSRAYPVRLCDISEGGAKVEMRTPMKKLSAATLSLPDLPPAPGYVRWVDDKRLGMGFDEPLPHHVLAGWAQARGARLAPTAVARPLAAFPPEPSSAAA
jgi:hypothetical protein